MLIVECIDDLVDGLSKNRLYKVFHIKKRKDGKLSYFLFDDYGLYNEFRSDRFRIEECNISLKWDD